MGYVNNFYGTDMSVRTIRLKKEEVGKKEEIIKENSDEKSLVAPKAKPVSASALDAIANIAKSEICIRGKKDNEIKTKESNEPMGEDKGGQNYEELVRRYYEACDNQATDEELIPMLREIIAEWTPDAQGIFGETRNLWQSTLAYRINRAYFADTLLYLQEGGDPNRINFDEIASFEKDLAETYKVPRDKYYVQNRKSVYGALVNMYSILLMRPGLSDEDRLELEAKLETTKSKLEQFQ